jgi:hypothetical protein
MENINGLVHSRPLELLYSSVPDPDSQRYSSGSGSDSQRYSSGSGSIDLDTSVIKLKQ